MSLINREDLIAEYDRVHVGAPGGARKLMVDAPEVKPEVIMCKDCVHWDTSWQNDYAPDYHYCPMVDGTRKDDFYCADAERRGEQNG